MFDKLFKKYQWFNKDLEKKHKQYNYATFIIAIIALICLYTLPENIKMVLTLVVVAGIVSVFLSWRIQEQDKKLRKERISQTK